MKGMNQARSSIIMLGAAESGEGAKEPMRALDCDCGQHLEAANDEELFERAREHVDRDHPEMQLSDEQVRGIVAEGAYDK